ncbi:MAG: hypothetical protein P1U88_16155 [Thalassobaculaceae bacterium]|nr:hypothetical protein [Thalassobaculaceae bacterium]
MRTSPRRHIRKMDFPWAEVHPLIPFAGTGADPTVAAIDAAALAVEPARCRGVRKAGLDLPRRSREGAVICTGLNRAIQERDGV